MNPNAKEFVFKPNPSAPAFTPGAAFKPTTTTTTTTNILLVFSPSISVSFEVEHKYK